jgi:UrcA family protein
MKTIVFAIAAAVAIGGSAARAQTPGEITVARVGFADLDLRRPAGRESLERRVDRAVRRVCGTPEHTDLLALARIDSCRRHARADANIQLAAAYGQPRYADQGVSGLRSAR